MVALIRLLKIIFYFMKEIVVLGSTGFVGKSTLQVVRNFKKDFTIKALCAKSNIDLLEKQIKEFSPAIVAVYDEKKAKILKKRIASNTKVVSGIKGILEVATVESDFVMAAMSGTLALVPIIQAIEAKRTIGVANKEILVAGGDFIVKLAKKKGALLLPVDSEHNAIFQCLKNEDPKDVSRLILTCSGGPFRSFPKKKLESVTLENALLHPTYKMGKNILINCSTLMNKGLEVIEAHFLFSVAIENIDVIIHPQSIVHSLVEFKDGSILAQMNEPDMTIPIQYALTYPNRKRCSLEKFDFKKFFKLEFFEPDFKKFICLSLAYEAAKIKKSMPIYLNAANEILVEKFLQKKIRWIDIGFILEKLLLSHKVNKISSLEDILQVDEMARKEALQYRV